MSLTEGTSHCIWAWPKGSTNVKMTWCSTALSDQMHLWRVLLIIICTFNWVIDNWTENVCKLIFSCCCCFACVILLLLLQQNYTVQQQQQDFIIHHCTQNVCILSFCFCCFSSVMFLLLQQQNHTVTTTISTMTTTS